MISNITFEERLTYQSAVKEKITMFKLREDKYRKRGIRYEMYEAFDYMKTVGLINNSHFHEEYFHDGYCDCYFCSNLPFGDDFLGYIYLKSYKLKMVYFQVLKKFRRGCSIGYYEKKKQKHLQRLRDERFKVKAKESVRQTDWMLSVSHDEYLQALSRLDFSNPASVSNWMNEERERHETKTN